MLNLKLRHLQVLATYSGELLRVIALELTMLFTSHIFKKDIHPQMYTGSLFSADIFSKML